MTWLVTLPVVIPLASAAAVAAGDDLVPEAIKRYPPIVAGLATSVVSLLLLFRTQGADVLQWNGGWQPRHGVAIGVAFVADPFGAGAGGSAAVIVTAAMVYSWKYMDDSPRLYRVLMLVFLGGCAGFALSGDLFNIFVWFELSAVAAYALAGYMVEELGPLQGAINFAITNSIGAFMLLFGIGLLYGRSGALNLAQLGASLSHSPPDGLVIVAFTLIVGGLLIKSALAPFHLWLADTYAVAPAPVCLVFAAVMSELGLFGIARIYWTVFSGALHDHEGAVTGVLLGIGAGTALIGAVMAFLQRHLKRLLAYTVIAHAGITLIGIALLDSQGLAGAANLVLSHGFLKGALFLGTGIVLRECRDVDELRLHGKMRGRPLLGMLLVAAAFGLVGFPYVGSFLGHSLVEEAAKSRGEEWIPPLLAIAGAVSMAAVLRSVARMFYGLGTRDDPLLTALPPEEPPEQVSNPPLMIGVVAVLVATGLGLGLVPGLQDGSEAGAERFRDRHAYASLVLHGERRRYDVPPAVLHKAANESVAYGLAAAAAAVGVALLGLYRPRVPGSTRVLAPVAGALRSWHTGVVADYVVWITVGTAIIGGIWALTLR